MINTEKNILVSLVSPCFNRKDLVKEMMDSVIAQTYIYWELLIVDDGSDESTLELLYEYQNIDDRIKIIQRDRTDKGACVCRNIGLRYANGKYIIFLDSDDFIAPFSIKQRVEYIERYQLDFAIFRGAIFREKVCEELIGKKVKDVVPLLMKFNPYLITGSVISDKDALIRNNIFWDEKIKGYQDIDFNLSLSLSGMKYDTAEKLPIDYFWRQHSYGNIGKSIVSFEYITTSHTYLYRKLYSKIYSNPQLRTKYKYDIYHCAGVLLLLSFTCENQTAPRALLNTMKDLDKIFRKINMHLFDWCAKKYKYHKRIVKFILYLFYPKIFHINIKEKLMSFLSNKLKIKNNKKG